MMMNNVNKTRNDRANKLRHRKSLRKTVVHTFLNGQQRVLNTDGDEQNTRLAEHATSHLDGLGAAGVTQLLHACVQLPTLGEHEPLVERNVT